MIGYKTMSRAQYAILAIAGFLFTLIVWSLLAYTGIVPPLFLPSPSQVLSALLFLFIDHSLITDIGASLMRIAVGLLVSVAVSIPVGFALALYRKFEAFAEPLIDFVRHIPPSAFIPLSLVWLGIDESQKIAILFISITPYMTLLIADVVMRVPRSFVDVVQTMGANRIQIITRVVFPYALPGIWNAIRLMLGAAWTLVIIAEIVGAASGLGHLMIVAERNLRIDEIFAVIFVIGTMGILTDYLFKLGYMVLFPWAKKLDV